MKPFKDYESTKTYSSSGRLPVGGYVLRIKNVKLEKKDGMSDQLIFFFDIDEGEYQDYYNENYKAQTQEDKKWKGTYRLWCPQDDGSEKDEWSKRRFKTVMNAFEDSNPGFKWDWDEKKLNNKLIGGIFNNKEYDIDGRNGFYTRCYSLTDVDAIRNGKFKIPADTLLKRDNAPVSIGDDFMKIPDSDDAEFPWQ